MAKKKAAPKLQSGLIARKGEASPGVSSGHSRPSSTPATPSEQGRTIAITVRLDEARYQRLKVYGATNRRTNQDIFVAALDAYLASLKA